MSALDGGGGQGRDGQDEVVDSAVNVSSGMGSELNRNQALLFLLLQSQIFWASSHLSLNRHPFPEALHPLPLLPTPLPGLEESMPILRAAETVLVFLRAFKIGLLRACYPASLCLPFQYSVVSGPGELFYFSGWRAGAVLWP